ncbi:MAG: UDP-N-acetylmuramoyl-L-alanine--D-glutamate ligase, partial [bacterium]|nr:UDP-N-acetylmuramoyl-L-alanine--D-glutamate ligase [bacterium]
MKIAILGYGAEGKSAYSYFAKDKSNQITICDEDESLELPKDVRAKLGEDYLKNLDKFDLIVRSPGIKLANIKTSKPVTSGVKIFFEKCPAKIIGVTGSKGKSTTTTLIYEILKAGHKKVWLGGNIGKPVLDFLDKVKPNDLVVLELSSFQLQDLDKSPSVAVALMIENEHLDYHQDFDEYFLAKANIFKYQKTNDTAVFNINDKSSAKLASFSLAKNKIPYGVSENNKTGARVVGDTIYIGSNKICSTNNVKLPGAHNLDNVLAAIAASWQFIKEPDPIIKALSTFTGLKHRLELVTETGGVKYYDDSIATTPSSAIAAIKAFKSPKVIILGGSDKGADFDHLAEVITSSNVIGVV